MSKAKPELKLVEDTGSQLLAEELIPELPPQQSEMPFAVVEGEPVTQLPRDLYIPPDALQVFLEAFEGPLDLLLYLIRKQNLDILDIPIAEITRQYMKYIEVMADLQLELAGEYLLMAAMLAEIKSRMLLPRPPSAEGADEEDPRAELVRRLQEYERFKKAAEDIDLLPRMERDNMPASAELQERKVVKMMPDVTLHEMLLAFKDVLTRAEKFAHHHISRERLSQRERMSDILSRLQNAAFFEFSQLFKVEEGRMGVTVTFIAILELMKEGLIEIVQAEAYAPIHVRTAQGARQLKVVPSGDGVVEADVENQAALAQPELAGENDIVDEEDLVEETAVVEETAEVPVDADAENHAALAQPELPGENDLSDDERTAEDLFAAEPTEIVEAHLDADSIEVIVVDAEAESEATPDEPEQPSEHELLVDDQASEADALAVVDHYEVADTPVEEVMSDEPIVVDAHVEAMGTDIDAAVEQFETADASVAEVTSDEPVVADATAIETLEAVADATDESALVESEPELQGENELVQESVSEGESLAAEQAETTDASVAKVASDESVVVDASVVETFEDAIAGDVTDDVALAELELHGENEPIDESISEGDTLAADQFEIADTHVETSAADVSLDEPVVVDVTAVEAFVADAGVADEPALAESELQVESEPAEEPVDEVDTLAAEHFETVDIPGEAVSSDEPIVVDAEGVETIAAEAGAEGDTAADADSEAILDEPELLAEEATEDESSPATEQAASHDSADAGSSTAVDVEEHLVEQHVVAEHVVEENVVEEHAVDTEVSGDDDKVTGSLSGADNPDAGPSR